MVKEIISFVWNNTLALLLVSGLADASKVVFKSVFFPYRQEIHNNSTQLPKSNQESVIKYVPKDTICADCIPEVKYKTTYKDSFIFYSDNHNLIIDSMKLNDNTHRWDIFYTDKAMHCTTSFKEYHKIGKMRME